MLEWTEEKEKDEEGKIRYLESPWSLLGKNLILLIQGTQVGQYFGGKARTMASLQTSLSLRVTTQCLILCPCVHVLCFIESHPKGRNRP